MSDEMKKLSDADLDQVVGGLMLGAGVIEGIQIGKAESGSTNLLGKNVSGGITNALAGGSKNTLGNTSGAVKAGKASMPTDGDIIRVSGGTSGMV